MTSETRNLARILLLQNMLSQLVDKEAMVSFVCRGLEEIPGVAAATYRPENTGTSSDPQTVHFLLQCNRSHYGEICLSLAMPDNFKPYQTYISNLCFMIAVILEERRQGQLNLQHQQHLEEQVNQRTKTLQEEVRERRIAEKRALKEKQRAELYLDISEAMIVELDKQGKICVINKRGCEILGYEQSDLLGQDWIELCLPADVQPTVKNVFNRAMAGQDEADEYFENEIIGRDGGTHYIAWHNILQFDDAGKISGVLCSGIDITERRRAEEKRLNLEKKMLHTQKLESLGVLAGGIAHDFNNLLAAIMGHAELSKRRLNPESPALDNLNQIEKAAERAADLSKQMLAYSGKGTFVVENIDLNHLLEEMLHMLEVSISKKAVLRLNPYSRLPPVEADATQLRQIIMNLVINASEAIGDNSGVISITTGCMDCDRSYLKDVWLAENLIDGLYVYLEIADTGCGMSKTTLARLFDPFFTTKFTGRGLGMSATLGIVRGHKGAINVYSEPGKGTTFKILLPASGRPIEIFNGESLTDNWQRSGKVLLVDDEETVRGIGSEMIKELGFTALTANDGREALDVFSANPDIVLVILDLTMPHMDGVQCYRELRQLKPDVKVILSSGYTEHEVTQKFIGKGLAGFVQKPYKLSVLKEVIRKLI